MSMSMISDSMSVTLMTRFLNDLELLDSTTNENNAQTELIKEHEDLVVKNLLQVGKVLEEREILWVGQKKRKDQKSNKEDVEEDGADEDTVEQQGEDSSSTSSPPLALIVLIDKVGKLGRKATKTNLISSCLKFYAGILISVLSTKSTDPRYEAAFLSMLRLIDHVQTFTISRDKVYTMEWKSTLELAKVLLERVKDVCGDEEYSRLNLRMIKTTGAARIARKQEKKNMVPLLDPEQVALMKSKENQKKYKARKVKKALSRNRKQY